MPTNNAFTRREFVNSSLTVVSTAFAVPMFIQQSADVFGATADSALMKERPGFPDDRVLVVVELSGGNDGLNTVVPYGERVYNTRRPQLRIEEGDVLKVDDTAGIGLHPNLAAFKSLMDDGLAAVVQGVGYPNPNRSHFASMDIWHTADVDGKGHGWIGKAVDHAFGASGITGTECICVQRQAALATQGKRSRPVAFENAELFRWIGDDIHSDLGSTYDTINRAGDIGGDANSQQAFLMRTALDAQLSSDRIRKAVRAGTKTTFPGTPLANQLRMVASMIAGELPTNVYYTALGGFDTHANQSFRHGANLTQLATALQAFYRELKATGHDKRVLTLVFSEFGRRVGQNASGGTDHGTAGPMFLVGPMVKTGLIGAHPKLTDLDNGDLKYNIDFRSVYTDVLSTWFNTDAAKVLGQKFKPAGVIKA